MDLSEDDSCSSRGSSKSAKNKGRNGSKSTASKTKSAAVTKQQIEQFCAVTGSTEEVARNLIEACNGNLEVAVNMHMEGISGSAAVEAGEDYVRAPIPQKQEILVQSGYEGYGFGQKGKRRIIKSVFDSFRNFEVETKLQESRLMMEQGGQSSTSVSGMSSKRTLEDLFRPPIDLIFKGNLQEARDVGTQTNKWLMVNVQNVSEFPCQVLNRDVWSNGAIKELIKENFLFLQVYMDSEEGERYMTFYKVSQWPYVAVLDPRTGELMAEWWQSDASTYIELITDFVACNVWKEEASAAGRTAAPDTKKRRVETILDASEDDQLQAAIRASLVASQKGDDGDDDDDEGHSTSDDDGSQSEGGADLFDSESNQSEVRAAAPPTGSTTGAPPAAAERGATPATEAAPAPAAGAGVQAASDGPGAGHDDWRQHLGADTDPVSSLVFRYPDGTKEQWSLPCSSSIQAVIRYADSKGFPAARFELMANFPKRQLLTMEPATTLKEAGLYPQDTIFVQAR